MHKIQYDMLLQIFIKSLEIQYVYMVRAIFIHLHLQKRWIDIQSGKFVWLNKIVPANRSTFIHNHLQVRLISLLIDMDRLNATEVEPDYVHSAGNTTTINMNSNAKPNFFILLQFLWYTLQQHNASIEQYPELSEQFIQ